MNVCVCVRGRYDQWCAGMQVSLTKKTKLHLTHTLAHLSRMQMLLMGNLFYLHHLKDGKEIPAADVDTATTRPTGNEHKGSSWPLDGTYHKRAQVTL